VPPARIDWPSAILERTGGEFAVARELARARREGRQLSVVLFDVGPAPAEGSAELQSPDERLEAISDTLLRAIRQSDLPIRWSVNELLVVLPGLNGTEARTVAERVRAALQAGSGHRLNVSGGVAEFEDKERFADVVDRARQKVAMAVGRGHNRVL
jgi:diguanylate cyclase (GGDEF)-like protein